MNAHLGPEAVEGIREETPLLTLGTPEDVAAAVCFLACEDARFLTGQVLCCDGGALHVGGVRRLRRTAGARPARESRPGPPPSCA